MRKEVSSIGSIQPIDSTRANCATRGLGTTRKVGSGGFGHPVEDLAVVLMPIERTVTPRGDISNFTSGIEAITLVNCGAENDPCSTGTW